jgi:hypothetical protein
MKGLELGTILPSEDFSESSETLVLRRLATGLAAPGGPRWNVDRPIAFGPTVSLRSPPG